MPFWVQDSGYIKPRIMLVLMPALRTLLQGLIVSFFILLNEALQADIASNLISQLVALEQKQKARDSAIPIPEGMNTQKIKVNSCQR